MNTKDTIDNEKVLIGKDAVEYRKNRIKDLFSVIKGNRGWRGSFINKYDHFDTLKGGEIINSGMAGRCDDPILLKALEEFVPWVQETQPEWYKKQKTLPDGK